MNRQLGYRRARTVLSDLYKLVTLGYMSKAVYSKMRKKPLSQQQKVLAQYKRKHNIRADELSSLKRKVKAISEALESDKAVHIHRKRSSYRQLSNGNLMDQTNYTVFNVANLETAMANLRYFDPGTNALVTADPSSGTYSREITVSNLYAKICAYNNYQVPCKLNMYAFSPKRDTNTTPVDFFSAGLTDQGNPTSTSPLVHITDSRILRENWKIVSSVSKMLYPGQSLSLNWSTKKPFEYDFSNTDTHATSFQNQYGALCFVVRLEGVIGHDTANNEQGQLPSGIDVELQEKYEFSYDAGKNLEDISISDSFDVFTNQGVVSNKPVSDNQGYSVA